MAKREGELPDSIRRWPDRAIGPYVVKLVFDQVDGRPVCVGVQIWGRTPPGETVKLANTTPVTATALRLPLGRLIAAVAREAGTRTPDFIDYMKRTSRLQPSQAMVEGAKRARATWAARQGVGRPPIYDEAHWKNVARVYSEAWELALPPLQAVMEAYHVHKTTAAKWVAKARARGYLEPTSRGVPGGVRTTKKRRKS